MLGGEEWSAGGGQGAVFNVVVHVVLYYWVSFAELAGQYEVAAEVNCSSWGEIRSVFKSR